MNVKQLLSDLISRSIWIISIPTKMHVPGRHRSSENVMHRRSAKITCGYSTACRGHVYHIVCSWHVNLLQNFFNFQLAGNHECFYSPNSHALENGNNIHGIKNTIIYLVVEWCFSCPLIGCSIAEKPALLTSDENKMTSRFILVTEEEIA